jgi:hyaluronoglucosaminidase
MIEVKPNPTYTKWEKEIGAIEMVHIKGKVHYWEGLYEDNSWRMETPGIKVDLYLDICPESKKFQFQQQYIVTGDSYYIEIKSDSLGHALVWITAKTLRGYYYAYLTWSQIQTQKLVEGMIFDQPKMNVRGIVEGYYGNPWSHEERLRAFQIMASQKMNTYVYAPKNDRYHRDLWAVPYPPDEEQQLASLISESQKHFLDFVFAISPGITISYSSKQERELLVGKLRQVNQLGVQCFGLFFDDVPMSLQHEQDQWRFGELVNAQIYLVQSIYSELKKLDVHTRLMVCPTLYFGEGNEEYITKLSMAVPKDVSVLWTGRRICSPEITKREARQFYEQNQRYPLYWDNYPVNDANMRDELHIGPLLSRDPKLFLYSQGLIANVMEYAEASMIPMITIAHYLWNPEVYDPSDSFIYAVKNIVGVKEHKAFLLISDCINQSVLSPLPGNEFMMQWWVHQRTWKEKQTKEQFRALVLQYKKMAELLLSMQNEKLKKEIYPWIKQVIDDFDYLLSVVSYDYEKDQGNKNQIKARYESRYKERAKALGFMPCLIATEILEKD